MNTYYKWIIIACICIACKTKFSHVVDPKQDTLHILVDQSFKPIMEQEIGVYESSFPRPIQVQYLSSLKCIEQFEQDSTIGLIVTSLPLSAQQKEYDQQNWSFVPPVQVVGYSAIALIVNQAYPDSFVSLHQWYNMLSGKDNQTVVLDGLDKTGIYVWMQDSVLRQTSFGKNVVGIAGSLQLLQMVASNSHIIGCIDMNWLFNFSDSMHEDLMKYIRTLYVPLKNGKQNTTFVRPSPSTIWYGQYPFVYRMYCITKENFIGKYSHLAGFLTGERGQLILQNGGLIPARMNLSIRKVDIQ